MDAVTAVLAARARPEEGFARMLGWSMAAHAALVTVAVLVPAAWLGARPGEPEVIMQISLGGPEGPRDGGLATLGGRPIQEVTESPKPIEPVRPPAPRTPEMVEPLKAPPKKTTPTAGEARDPRSRTPTKGAEVQPGTAVAETGARGQGFGLTGGAGGSGGYLDVANFCCPEYLAVMRDLINRNWSSRQGTPGVTLMRFVIHRDGRLTDVLVERSSGNAQLDLFARRALLLTRLPPLPAEYPEPTLGVHLYFEYTR